MLRRRRILIQEQILVGLLLQGSEHHFRVEAGLPEDAAVLLVTKDRGRSMIEVEIVSSEFEAIPDGRQAPLLPIVCEEIPDAG